MTRYATNIENEGGCPDCDSYERKIDRMNAKMAELEAQLSSKEQELKDEIKTNENLSLVCDDLRAENDRLKNDLEDMTEVRQGRGPTALSNCIIEIKELRKRCEDLEAKREWISVNDRLPEERVMECLVFNGDAPEYNQNVASATWFNQSKTFRRHSGGHLGTITHWMPMVKATKLLSQ